MKKLPLIYTIMLIVLLYIVLSVPSDGDYPWQGKWINETGNSVPEGIGIKIVQYIPLSASTYCECATNSSDYDFNDTDGSWSTTTARGNFIWNGLGNDTNCGVGLYSVGQGCGGFLTKTYYTYAVTTNASFLGFEEGFALPYPGAFVDSVCTFNNGTLIKNNPPNITGIPDNWTYEDIRPTWEIDLCNYTTDDRDNCSNITFSVIVQNTTLINAFIRAGRYLNFTQPGANLSGATLVTIIATDSNGRYDNDTFTMTVIPVNDPPYWLPITANTNEDTTPPDNWINLHNYGLDIDNASTQLTYTLVNQTNASLINCNVINSGGIRYLNCTTPAPDQIGTNIVTLNVTDGEYSAIGTAIINVLLQNDPPYWNATPPNSTIAEDSGLNILINLTLANLTGYGADKETPTSLLTYIVSSENTGQVNCDIVNGTVLVATPAANWNGIAQCGLKVYDGSAYSVEHIVYINVTEVPDPPNINNAFLSTLINTQININLISTMSYSDPDINDTHNFTLVGTAPNGTNFTITDNMNGLASFIGSQVGQFNFTINVTDKYNLSDTAILTIEVVSVDVFVFKTIEAIGENQYQVTVTILNYNNESKDFKNLTLVDADIGNVTFDLDYRTIKTFSANVTIAGSGITAFPITEVYNPSLNTYYYSNEESVYITVCSPGGGGGGGGGGSCPPCEYEECPEPECPPEEQIDSCEEYCVELGYDSGTCRQNKHECEANDENWLGNGNKYCNLAQETAGSCCCSPTAFESKQQQVPVVEAPAKGFNICPLIALGFASLFLLSLFLLFRRKLIFVTSKRNLFRGPIIEHMLRKKLKEAKLGHKYKVRSGGILALNDIAPSQRFIDLAKEHNLDVSKFKTKAVTNKMLQNAVMLVVMNENEKNLITKYVPDLYKKHIEKKIVVLDIGEVRGRHGTEHYKRSIKDINQKIDKEDTLKWIKKIEEEKHAKRRRKNKKNLRFS